MDAIDRQWPDISDINDPNTIVAAFAHNPAFRAAEWSELTTPDNPFRRPVRADDLAWVKYHDAMPESKALRLSALLGHRMLRNIHDLDTTLVAPVDGVGTVTADRVNFYSHDNRVRAEAARPVLEHHLFDFLVSEDGSSEDVTVTEVIDHVAQTVSSLSQSRLRTTEVAETITDLRPAAVFVLIQYHGFVPAIREALGRVGIGEYPPHLDTLQSALINGYRDWLLQRTLYRALLDAADLTQTPGAYWQLLLGTSLARGNHILSLASDRSRLAEFAGAAVFSDVVGPGDTAALSAILTRGLGNDVDVRGFDLGTGGFTETEGFLVEILPALARCAGSGAPAAFRRGFTAAQRLRQLWDTDLAAQLSWADRIELHTELAERIHGHIVDNNIDVDLDTFVESEEETSTTHVHNEHRLVMIENGNMHFWNNVTHKIELTAGDKILIPVSRLHGSTVLSGECTYHQPIIPDDMLREIL